MWVGEIGISELRIALELSEKSEEALIKIIELVENYGQDANSSYRGKFLYDNAFLISYKDTAFYIETVSIEAKCDKISIKKMDDIREKENINFKY
jgi:hypothetical protein